MIVDNNSTINTWNRLYTYDMSNGYGRYDLNSECGSYDISTNTVTAFTDAYRVYISEADTNQEVYDLVYVGIRLKVEVHIGYIQDIIMHYPIYRYEIKNEFINYGT
jgi:hypothetical protein